MCATWSLITPLMASYDEPAHLYAAASAVRQIRSGPLEQVGELGLLHRVEIPPKLAELQQIANCLAGQPQVPANCATIGEPGRHTQYMRYPRLYYMSVGWPTLVFEGRAAARLVRTASAVLTGALLGLGLWLLSRFHTNSALAVPAGAIALTPTVLSIGGTINSSSMEIAAAFAAWCGMASILSRDNHPRALIWSTSFALSLLMVSRPLSPVWAVMVILGSLTTAGKSQIKGLWSSSAVRWASGLVMAAAASAVAWYLLAGRPPLLRVPGQGATESPLVAPLGRLIPRLLALGGDYFGVRSPAVISLYLVLGLGCLVAIARKDLRRITVAVMLFFVVIAISLLVEAAQYEKIGLWWQTRYFVPGLLGIPILLVRSTPELGSLSYRQPLLYLSIAAQGVSLAWVYHRYGSGIDGSWWPPDYVWQPPIGLAGVILVTVLSLGAYSVALRSKVADGFQSAPLSPDHGIDAST